MHAYKPTKVFAERGEQSRNLAEPLPRERERTDLYLRTERELSDESLSTWDAFLGIVSHDLRNHLAAIAMCAKVMKMQASDSEEGRETISNLEKVESCVACMARLIGDLVDVTGIEAGKLSLHPLPGDVVELLSEAVSTFFEVARAKGISLTSATRGRDLACGKA